MTNFFKLGFFDPPNKLERCEPEESQGGKREALEKESCWSPASLGTVGQGQYCSSSRVSAGRLWALPEDGRTLLLLFSGWGFPGREAQCVGLGPGVFVPHLTLL